MERNLDSALMVAVSRYGTKKWNKVAVLLDLNPKYCEYYWNNVLQPKVMMNLALKSDLAPATLNNYESEATTTFRDEADAEDTGELSQPTRVPNTVADITDLIIAAFLKNLNYTDPSIKAWIKTINRLRVVTRKCDRVTNETASMLLTLCRSRLENEIVEFFVQICASHCNDCEAQVDDARLTCIKERFLYLLRENVE